MPDKAKLLIQTAEARKLVEQAIREIEMERTTFGAEIERFKMSGKACRTRGEAKDCRQYAMAARMLTKKLEELTENTDRTE